METLTGPMPAPTQYMVCEWCGRRFPRPTPTGRLPKYCSPAHRQQAYQAATAHPQRNPRLELTGEHLLALKAATATARKWWPGTDDEPKLAAMEEALSIVLATNR